MEYLSIKDLAAKFAMPERTVYYQINHTTGIRTRKQGRKKSIHVADFAKACGKDLQGIAINTSAIDKKPNDNNEDERLQTLQEQTRLDKERIFALEKVNNNLETARNKFVQLYTDEKKEKAEVRGKLDALQEKYHTDIQTYMRKYHLVIGIAVMCVTILLILNIDALIILFGLRG